VSFGHQGAFAGAVLQQRGARSGDLGHRGHVEVEGTYRRVRGGGTSGGLGRRCGSPASGRSTTGGLCYPDYAQSGCTRAIVEAIKQRFPDVRGPELSDICYAAQSCQNAVRSLAAKMDVILVVGARNSSNSARLREVDEMSGGSAYLI
jgi:4-hydroxy-3-methylbut-2-enyl diphosphate reductase